MFVDRVKALGGVLFVCLICQMFSVTWIFAEGAAPVSFVDAWNMVEDNNDALKAARAKVHQAQYAKEGAQDLNFPEVSLSAAYLYLDDAVELTPHDIFASMEGGDQASRIAADLARSYGMTPAQMNAGLTSTIAERENLTSSIRLSWPVYTGGRIEAVQRIAADQAAEAQHELDLARLRQFEALIRYYFGAVLSRKVYETHKEAEARLKIHRDHAVHLEEQGQIAKVERMQSEAAYDKAVVDRKKAQRDLEIAMVALTRLLKSSQQVFPADDLFVADSIPDIDDFTQATLARYPGLDVLERKRSQADGLAAVEKGKYLPSVALMGNYSLYEEDNLATKLTPEWFVGVGVKLTLVDRSGRSAKLMAARTAGKRLQHMSHQAKSDLSVLVEKTYRQAQQALEEYEGLKSSRQLAQETVNLRAKAFNQGLSTSLDVVDAELFLASVETQRAVAVYNYVVALGKLFSVSNRPEAFIAFQNYHGTEEYQ